MKLDVVNDGFISQLSHIDFRYWFPETVFLLALLCQLVSLFPISVFFLVLIGIQNPSSSVVRVEPSSPMDHRLLEYFNLVIGSGIAKPATFPLRCVSP